MLIFFLLQYMQSEKYFKAKQELEYLLQVQKYLDKHEKVLINIKYVHNSVIWILHGSRIWARVKLVDFAILDLIDVFYLQICVAYSVEETYCEWSFS